MTKPNCTLEERLAKHSTATDHGCIEWTGCKLKQGYGRLNVRGSLKLAHRISYEISVGPVPDGMCVLHRCDNPSCILPSHLFLGTKADNTNDCVAKGRQPRAIGQRNRNNKLTPEQVLQIRQDTRSGSIIAAEYGIGPTQVSRIRRGELWKHLP